jgi:hypothetical protein
MTDDLRQALVRLSERGDPAGIEALVERIDLEVGTGSGRTTWPERKRTWVARRRPWVLATALTVAFALVAAAVLVVAGSGSDTTDRQVGSGAVAPERLQVGLRAPLPSGGRPVTHLTTAGGSLWATVGADADGRSTLFRLDPASGAVRSRVAIPGNAVDLAPGFGAVWVAVDANGAGGGRLVRVDAATGHLQATVDLATPAHVAVGAGAVWVTDTAHGELTRVDPAHNVVAGTITVPEASAVAVTGDLVYVAQPGARTVAVIDAVLSSKVITASGFSADAVPDALVTSGTRVWAISTADGTVWDFEAGVASAAPAHAGGAVTAAAPAPQGALWLAVADGATRLGLLRQGSTQLAPVAAGARRLEAGALTQSDAGLWIADAPSTTLTLLEAR